MSPTPKLKSKRSKQASSPLHQQLLQPLKEVWHDNWVKAWAYVKAGTGATLLVVSQFNASLTDPNIKSYLDKIDLPKSVTIGLIVLGIITFIASPK
jgi:hypothetical protein